MTADTTSKICENPKKKKQIDAEMKANNLRRKISEDLWKVWSCSYCLSPLGVAKEQNRLQRLPL